MKTHLLVSVAKLDQIIQTLEERQPKLTISKTTMIRLLPELPCPDHKTKPYLKKSIELIYFIIEFLNVVHS
jgi:hypothetical protein